MSSSLPHHAASDKTHAGEAHKSWATSSSIGGGGGIGSPVASLDVDAPTHINLQRAVSATIISTGGGGAQSSQNGLTNEYMALCRECEAFIVHGEENLAKYNALGSGAMRRLKDLVHMNKRDTALCQTFETLKARLLEAETAFTKQTDKAIDSQLALMTQATHMRPRIEACKRYNEESCQEQKANIDKATLLVSDLSAAVKQVQEAIVYLDEVALQKENQLEPYVPWAQRVVSIGGASSSSGGGGGEGVEATVAVDNKTLEAPGPTVDRLDLRTRLRMLVKAKKCAINALQTCVAKKTAFQECQHSLETAQRTQASLLARIRNRVEDDEDSDSEAKEQPAPYDHKECDDCSAVVSMIQDCALHLTSCYYTANECTDHLKTLLELQERVRIVGAELENHGWGEH